jgi:hypothetical protein
MKIAKTSVALLVIQLAIVGSIAGKYFYERWKCPHVWTRAAMYDPELLMRGRYLSMQLTLDGCKSTLPSAKQAIYPRNIDGTPRGNAYSINGRQFLSFQAEIKAEDNELVAIRLPESDGRRLGQAVTAGPGASCDNLRLQQAVNFYIAEHAASPLPVKAGQELWVEVTVPPKGPPRPIQLALKADGSWKTLAFQ